MVLKYLLTGGSYAGKTTIIQALNDRGFTVIEEAAMMMIKETLKTGVGPLPWIDKEGFENAILPKRIELESLIDENTNCVFIDRGIPDGIAYAISNGRKPTEAYIKAAQQYRYDKVFLLDLLPNYKEDREKKESPEMRIKLHLLIEETYTELGYELIKVPVMPVDERVEFILNKLSIN